jgi:tetratricopeptide (TPR) repeat protein
MSKLLNLSFFLLLFLSARGQGNRTKTDSLVALIKTSKEDTSKIKLLIEIGKSFTTSNPRKSIDYGKQAFALASKLNWKKGILSADNLLGTGYSNSSSYDTALNHYQASIDVANRIGDKESVSIAYTNIGVLYYFKANYLKALEYYSKAKKICEEIGDEEGVAYSYHDIAVVYNYQGKYFEALNAYDSAQKTFERIGNKTAIASIYNNVGIIQAHLGNYDAAIKSYLTALKANEAQNNLHGMATNYSGIGMVYTFHQDYNDALQYNFKALKLFIETNDKRNEGTTLSNISAIFSDKDSLRLALHYDSLALKISDSLGIKDNIAHCYLTMGVINAKMKAYQLSIRNYQTAFTLFQNIGDTSNLSLVNDKIARAYFNEGKYYIAENFALKALGYASKIGETQRIRDAHETLSEVYEKIGDYRKSLIHYRAFVSAKDSLFNETNTKKITQAQSQYEFDKRQLVIDAEHKRQLTGEEEKRKMWGIVVIALLIIGLGSFYFYRKFQKNRLKLQVSEISQKTLVAQLNNHFVLGTLTSINEFIIRNDRDSASQYLSRFSILIRGILGASLQKSVTIQEEVDFINSYLEIFLLRYPKGHIAYSISIQAGIDSDNICMPPKVLQVLVDNAILHGFDNRQGGVLTIQIKKADNSILCQVEDNGKGRREAENKKDPNRASYGGRLAGELLDVWTTLFGKTSYKITDLTTVDGRASGTLVEFMFPLIEK